MAKRTNEVDVDGPISSDRIESAAGSRASTKQHETDDQQLEQNWNADIGRRRWRAARTPLESGGRYKSSVT